MSLDDHLKRHWKLIGGLGLNLALAQAVMGEPEWRSGIPGEAGENPRRLKCALILLKSGASPSLGLDSGVGLSDGLLHLCAKTHRPECLKALVEAGAKPDSRGALNRTPLHCAALTYSSDCAQALIELGASIEARDAHGFTPLLCAADALSLGVFKQLLSAGASPEVANHKGESALTLLERIRQEEPHNGDASLMLNLARSQIDSLRIAQELPLGTGSIKGFRL